MTLHPFPLRHALFACLLALLAACGDKDRGPGYDPPENADQTVLLYMPGRDLEVGGGYYSHNIETVCQAVSARVPGNGRMLVCWQPESHAKATLFEVYYDRNRRTCGKVTLKEYAGFDAGTPASVRQLFADAAELAPAQRYGLIIGCHGKAWIPAASGSITNRSAQGLWTPAPGALKTRAFGDPGHELDITELAGILESLPYRNEYLLLDDCFMANIETLYDLRHAVDYIVASPCEIMAAGFPYDRALPCLFEDDGASYDLRKVCREFWDFYENDWDCVENNAQSGCISLAETARLDALAEAMADINRAGRKNYDAATLQVYEGLRSHVFYDLGHFAEAVCPDAALLERFRTQLDRAFPPACRLHTATFYSMYSPAGGYGGSTTPVEHYTGVSVSEPSANYVSENRQTAWYLATHPQ